MAKVLGDDHIRTQLPQPLCVEGVERVAQLHHPPHVPVDLAGRLDRLGIAGVVVRMGGAGLRQRRQVRHLRRPVAFVLPADEPFPRADGAHDLRRRWHQADHPHDPIAPFRPKHPSLTSSTAPRRSRHGASKV